MNLCKQSVRFCSLSDEVVGTLFLPQALSPAPVLIVCHGAGEFKENYTEMCEQLASRGLASLAIDMHGHGESGGERFHVDMNEWVADIVAAIDFVSTRKELDASRVGAFGLSSGGTAILEAGVVEPRLHALVALDATVHNSLPFSQTAPLKLLDWSARVKRCVTGRGFRVPLAKLSVGPKIASDPEINARLMSNPKALEAFMAFPFPGATQAFFVDTITRVAKITAPTLVIWGEDDQLDPPSTAHLLFDTLTCKKELRIVKGNGHVGHLDRNRAEVFAATGDWVLKHLESHSVAAVEHVVTGAKRPLVIEGEAAKKLARAEKWDLLSPFLKQYGCSSLAYATLQEGMEYFVDDLGYIAYTTVKHPVLSPKARRITLSDPVCAVANIPKLIERFLSDNPRASFGVISEACADVLHGMGFKVNCIGYEPEIPVQTYNTLGNWKELDLIKRARNEAKREGLTIREESGEALKKEDLASVSTRWIGSKKISDREIWLYARRPVFDHENDVRKFVAYDREGKTAGFAFYDPMYRDGQVYGYSANIVRCDESRYGRLATAVHMEAAEKFRSEGKQVLNLLLAPFVKLDLGKYNDDLGAKLFFKLSARFGNDIYNFKGLSFHKSKYRGSERPLYYASNSLMPSNDIYLAFVSADITRSYFATLGRLLRGMVSAVTHGKSN